MARRRRAHAAPRSRARAAAAAAAATSTTTGVFVFALLLLLAQCSRPVAAASNSTVAAAGNDTAAAAAADTAEAPAVCVNPNLARLLGAPAADFDVVSWVEDAELGPKAVEYLRHESLRALGPVAVLLALAALVLFALLLWRFVRCCCVVCCNQGAYGRPEKILCGRRLKILKAAACFFAAAALAIGAWGMTKVPRDLAGRAWGVADQAEGFAAGLAGGVSRVSGLAGNLTAPLDALELILDRDVDVPRLRANLSAAARFLDAAPSPSACAELLRAVDAALKGQLRGALQSLAALVATGGPIDDLRAHMAGAALLAGPQLAEMDFALGNYSNAIRAALDNGPPAGPTDARVTTLQAANLRVDVAAWRAKLAAGDAALAALQDAAVANDPAHNPLDRLANAVDAAGAAADELRDELLPPLAGNITAFNAAFLDASGPMRGLVDRAIHIDRTVVALPEEQLELVNTVNATLAAVEAAYTSNGTDPLPLTLAPRIEALRQELQLPPDAPKLAADARGASAALVAAAPAFGALRNALSGLSALIGALEPGVLRVRGELARYVGNAAPWAPNVFHALTDTAPETAVASAATTAVRSTAAPQVAGPLDAAVAEIDALAPRRADASAALAVALAAIDSAPDAAAAAAALDSAAPAYDSLPSPRSKALDGILEVLDEVESERAHVAADVRARVKAAREPLDDAAAMILKTRDGIAAWRAGHEPTIARYQGYAYKGLLGAYALVMLLLLATVAAGLKNWPAGACLAGTLLATCLVVFCVLPVVHAALSLVLRDGCAHAEGLAAAAVDTYAPSFDDALDALAGDSAGAAGAHSVASSNGSSSNNNASPVELAVAYYLGDPSVQRSRTAAEAFAPVFDVAALKSSVTGGVDSALGDLRRRFDFRPQVVAVFDGAKARADALVTGIDDALDLVSFTNVRALYDAAKAVPCCAAAGAVYSQWLATLALGYACLAALLAALCVLRQLDALGGGGCCGGCACYRKRDYSAPLADARRAEARLSSYGDEDAVVAQVVVGSSSYGGGAAAAKQRKGGPSDASGCSGAGSGGSDYDSCRSTYSGDGGGNGVGLPVLGQPAPLSRFGAGVQRQQQQEQHQSLAAARYELLNCSSPVASGGPAYPQIQLAGPPMPPATAAAGAGAGCISDGCGDAPSAPPASAVMGEGYGGGGYPRI